MASIFAVSDDESFRSAAIEVVLELVASSDRGPGRATSDVRAALEPKEFGEIGSRALGLRLVILRGPHQAYGDLAN
jgi:hypothetical protein